jgi:hypothetical protein
MNALQTKTSGFYYKHVMIVNDDSIIVSDWSFKLIDDPRVVIYDCHRFILQAIDGRPIKVTSQDLANSYRRSVKNALPS